MLKKSEGPAGAGLALRYVIFHETNPTAIPGATSPKQVIANVKAGDHVLSPLELEEIRKVIEKYTKST